MAVLYNRWHYGTLYCTINGSIAHCAIDGSIVHCAVYGSIVHCTVNMSRHTDVLVKSGRVRHRYH